MEQYKIPTVIHVDRIDLIWFKVDKGMNYLNVKVNISYSQFCNQNDLLTNTFTRKKTDCIAASEVFRSVVIHYPFDFQLSR